MVKDHQAWRQFYRTVTVIVKAFVPVSPPLVAPIVTADVVAAVGVLELNPVAVLIKNPTRFSDEDVYGPSPPENLCSGGGARGEDRGSDACSDFVIGGDFFCNCIHGTCFN